MAYPWVWTGVLHCDGYRPSSGEVARLRAPVARAEGARSSRRRIKLAVVAPWSGLTTTGQARPVDGTPGYLDSFVQCLVVGGYGYLDNGIGLGRAGLFFAGASIGLLEACFELGECFVA